MVRNFPKGYWRHWETEREALEAGAVGVHWEHFSRLWAGWINL